MLVETKKNDKKRRRAFSPVFWRGLPVPFNGRKREAPPRIAPIRLGLGGARRPVYVCSGGGRGRARLLVRSHGTRTRPHVDVVGARGPCGLGEGVVALVGDAFGTGEPTLAFGRGFAHCGANHLQRLLP